MDGPNPGPVRSDRGSALIAAAIVAGALIMSWGISGSAPRYELAGAGATIVRMNTDSGELIACDMQRCARIQPPDRAKTIGALELQMGGKDEKASPAAESARANSQ